MSEKRTKASSTLCDIATGREEEEDKGRGGGCGLWSSGGLDWIGLWAEDPRGLAE